MRTGSQSLRAVDAVLADDTCEVNCVHPAEVERARTATPDLRGVEEASALLKAVADPTRLRLLSALKTGELCVCDLAAVVGSSGSAVSHQLRLLRAHRLVTFRKEGRIAYYRLLDHHVTVLIGSVLEHVLEDDTSDNPLSDNPLIDNHP
ncbi:ArsR/SmtB family transcription factor [Deinococcus sp.]|uniref:ArsR/SmtB family transcription factor n=1 Tax=Deinococcus sp. TaxID=47478 RepID=UPI003C7EAC1D